MARTCLLVGDPVIAGMPDLVAEWEGDRAAEGWSVLPSIFETDLAALTSRLAGLRPDHTFLIGDATPGPTVQANPDGHWTRAMNADYALVAAWGGAVGRCWFQACSGAGKSSTDLYRAYFAKRHAWAAAARAYPLRSSIVDHFYDNPAVEPYVAAARSILPATIPIESLQPPHDSDTTLAGWEKLGALFGLAFSGGEMFSSGLYYVGDWVTWKATDPQVPIFAAFGSFLCQMEWPNSLLMFALTGSHTLVSFYDTWGQLKIARMLSGATAGDVGRELQAAYNGISNVMGDPTVAIPQDVLTAAQVFAAVAGMQDQVTAIGARVSALEARPAGGGSVPPVVAPAVVVTSAVYRVKSSPVVTNDLLHPGATLAYVQKQAAAGLPVAATDAQGDPWPGQVKELVIAGTKGGVPFQTTIAEGDSAVL